jgi:hypothetical protein
MIKAYSAQGRHKKGILIFGRKTEGRKLLGIPRLQLKKIS